MIDGIYTRGGLSISIGAANMLEESRPIYPAPQKKNIGTHVGNHVLQLRLPRWDKGGHSYNNFGHVPQWDTMYIFPYLY